MRFDDAINIEDLHQLAKRRLPKVAFDFIEGGLEDERGLERNTAAFQKHLLLPRYLVDVSKRDQTQTIFGQTFSSPFGISPTGGAGLFRRGACVRPHYCPRRATRNQRAVQPGAIYQRSADRRSGCRCRCALNKEQLDATAPLSLLRNRSR